MVRALLVGSLMLMLLISAGCNKERDEDDDCSGSACASKTLTCKGGSCSSRTTKVVKTKVFQTKLESVPASYVEPAVPQVETKDGKQYWDGALIVKRGEKAPPYVTFVWADDLEKCKQCVGYKCGINQVSTSVKAEPVPNK